MFFTGDKKNAQDMKPHYESETLKTDMFWSVQQQQAFHPCLWVALHVTERAFEIPSMHLRFVDRWYTAKQPSSSKELRLPLAWII